MKVSFTTRFDPEVLDMAKRLAELERRSVTEIFELAVIALVRTRLDSAVEAIETRKDINNG